MLLRNGKIMLLSKINNVTIALKNIEGLISQQVSYSNVDKFFKTFNKEDSSNTGSCFVFGSGTTQEKETDFKLENAIQGLTVNSVSVNDYIAYVSYDDYDVKKYSFSCVVTNNTTNDVTISEFGIKSYYNGQYYLWYRKTFDPITLAPNDTYTFAIDLM